jgi:broad specificity phosphatase PhoE
VTVTRVHLVRHGEVFNPLHVLYGRLPGYPLSDLGERMAALAAKALAGKDVDVVYSSPLERAVQTAEPIAGLLGAGLMTDERITESASRFEGRVVEGWRSFADLQALRHLRNPFEPSWGEPYAQTARRMLAAVTEARDAARGREVVLVSHQLPIYVLRRFVEGRPLYHRPDRRLCGLASVTTLTWYDARLASVTYAEPAGELSRRPSTPGA